MSRRKDRERYEAIKSEDPNYQGFRGYGEEAAKPEAPVFETVVCSQCGRKRNVPVEVAQEQGEEYICLSCREETEEEAEPQEVAS